MPAKVAERLFDVVALTNQRISGPDPAPVLSIPLTFSPDIFFLYQRSAPTTQSTNPYPQPTLPSTIAPTPCGPTEESGILPKGGAGVIFRLSTNPLEEVLGVAQYRYLGRHLIQATQGHMTPVGQNITVEEIDPRLVFAPECPRANDSCDGGWTRWINPDGMNSSYRATYAPGAAYNFELPHMIFSFNGSAIYYYTVTWKNTAAADIYLDSNQVETVDLTAQLGLTPQSPRTAGVLAWYKEGLNPNVEHSLTIKYAGPLSARMGQSALRVDYLIYTDILRPSSSIPVGPVIGGVISALVAIALFVVAYMFWYKKRKFKPPSRAKRLSFNPNWTVDGNEEDENPLQRYSSQHSKFDSASITTTMAYTSVTEQEEEFGARLYKEYVGPSANNVVGTASTGTVPVSLPGMRSQYGSRPRSGSGASARSLETQQLVPPGLAQTPWAQPTHILPVAQPLPPTSYQARLQKPQPGPIPTDWSSLQTQQSMMLDVIQRQTQQIEDLHRLVRNERSSSGSSLYDRSPEISSASGQSERVLQLGEFPWERREATLSRTLSPSPPPYDPPPVERL